MLTKKKAESAEIVEKMVWSARAGKMMVKRVIKENH